MKQTFAAAAAGAVFGVGLGLSRMTDPTVVLGFLDLAGDFDPTLLFVMGGAVCVTVVAYRLILRRPHPWLAEAFQLPTSRAIDGPLLAGAALFGIGWGLAGYCPGPALVSIAAGIDTAMIFGVAMVAGMVLHRLTSRAGRAQPADPAAPTGA
jgi:uncharacterized membrane protein YedE/YeeE